MTITETCICGASLSYTSPSKYDIYSVIDKFHEAHRACLTPDKEINTNG